MTLWIIIKMNTEENTDSSSSVVPIFPELLVNAEYFVINSFNEYIFENIM